ncbi:MAG: transcription antitermination protein NusB [Marinilabiliaceae bacterium]|nr:transcription antitermination protein NusB [Marinilabiliaceae bacterium]
MLSRRLLRVKVMQMVYAHHIQEDSEYKDILNELELSVSQSHDLYMAFMLLPSALRKMAAKKIENGLNKIRPTAEEKNPNRRFVNNRLIIELERNIALQSYVEETGFSWTNDEDLLRTLFNKLIESKLYKDYMTSDEDSWDNDRAFILHYFMKELPTYGFLYDSLENKSMYWNDESEFCMSIAVKTFRLFDSNNGESVPMAGLWKDKDDKDFTVTLLRKTLAMYNEGFELIKKYSLKWDPERVTTMDTILIVMAIAEMTNFREMQIKITLNEYIEIGKYYSGEKSNVFINGILEKIVRQLFEEKRILPSQMQ